MKRSAFPLVCGGIRFGGEVFDPKLFASERKGLRTIATAVIGHDAIDSDAEASVVGDSGEQERNGTFLLLVWKDIGPSDTGMIINGDVNEVPTDALAAAMAAATASDAVTDRIESAELFDIEMNDLTGRSALVSWARLLWFEGREQAEAAAVDNARDGGCGDADLSCDLRLGVALPTQNLDDSACGRRGLVWR
jgi:hypothetical protein